jgi:predicted adenine nucleotide alpha hydrolase (AANH) superfamily ATPase
MKQVTKMKILMHTCCAPCSIMPLERLLNDGHKVCAYFYNPNIHPYKEYKQRKRTFIDYMDTQPVKVVIDNDYALEDFLLKVAHRVDTRCEVCYDMRLEHAAKYAAENGYDAYTSTLLVSIYQKHDLIRQIAEKYADKYGIEFYYEDFRPYFREGQEKARNLGLYMQGYCGCIYSEKDRYCRKKRKKQED